MYVAKIYSKQHQCAFIVLGHCRSAEQVIMEIDLFQLHTGIKVPARIMTEDIANYKWQNMTLLKFYLHPKCVFQKSGSHGDWLLLDNNPELLEQLRIKKYQPRQ